MSSRRDKPWVVCRRLWKRQLAKGNCDAHSSEAAMDTAGRMVVVGVGGVTVWRIHGIFGSEKRPSYADTKIDEIKPVEPNELTYEVFGPPGTVADISYFDINADPQHVDGAHLPWSLTVRTTLPAMVANILVHGNGDSLGCGIVVDAAVNDEKISHELNAFTFCRLKAV